MMPRILSRAAGAIGLLTLALPASGQPVCRPQLAVEDVRFSQMVGGKRYWWATIAVDATRCVEQSGRFEIAFVRIKEMAPDLEFSETMIWQRGRTDAIVEFGVDEAVHKYQIAYASPCTCRG